MAHPPDRSAGVRLTERDRRLLAFAADHRLVLERQLERLAGTKLGGRLRVLADHEYLSRGRVFAERYYQIRPKGLAAVGSKLPAPRFNLTGYKHDVGVAWLWLAARGGTFGPVDEVLSERVMRSHDGALECVGDPFGVRLGGVGRRGNARLHYPDLLVVSPEGGRLALELELTAKGRERRELILGGYGADRRIDRVLYLVEDDPRGRSTGRLVKTAAREMGLSDRVLLQLVKPLRVTGPPVRQVGLRAQQRPEAER